MAKKYTRKKIGSLDALDVEQERIKHRAKRIEDDWLDIFNPQQLAIVLGTKLLSRNKGTKGGGISLLPFKRAAKDSNVKTAAVNEVGLPGKKSALGKFARQAGISFVRWQLFNLAFFVAKKAVKAIKEKKNKQKVQAAV